MENKSNGVNSEATTSCLPEEVWNDILTRLPAETLVRYILVCKTWFSIIILMNNKAFISRHLNLHNTRQNNNELLITVERTEKNNIVKDVIRFRRSSSFKSISSKTIYLDEGIMVKGYSNEVFLLGRLDTPLVFQLWNPTIEKFASIPECPFFRNQLSSSYHSFSSCFGFDSLLHDYKVVVVKACPRLIFNRVPNSIAIFSLRIGLWNLKLIEDVGDWWLIKGNPVFSKGTLNWLARDKREEHGFSGRPTHIASFDLGSEAFTFVRLPEDGNEKEKAVRFIFLLRGSVALFDVSPWQNDIWILDNGKDAHKPWSKWFSTNSSHGSYEFFHHHGCNISHLCFAEKSNKFFMLIEKKTKSYDIKNHQIVDLRTSKCVMVLI